MTVVEMRKLLENVPDDLEVVIVMHYSFKPLIKGIADGQTLGGLKAMLAAKWILPHMEPWQTWHAYTQKIDVCIGPNHQTPELRLSNVTEPLCIESGSRPLQLSDGQGSGRGDSYGP